MTYCSVVIVLALVGLTKKHFGHYAIFKNLSLKSPSCLGKDTFLIHLVLDQQVRMLFPKKYYKSLHLANYKH